MTGDAGRVFQETRPDIAIYTTVSPLRSFLPQTEIAFLGATPSFDEVVIVGTPEVRARGYTVLAWRLRSCGHGGEPHTRCDQRAPGGS